MYVRDECVYVTRGQCWKIIDFLCVENVHIRAALKNTLLARATTRKSIQLTHIVCLAINNHRSELLKLQAFFFTYNQIKIQNLANIDEWLWFVALFGMEWITFWIELFFGFYLPCQKRLKLFRTFAMKGFDFFFHFHKNIEREKKKEKNMWARWTVQFRSDLMLLEFKSMDNF